MIKTFIFDLGKVIVPFDHEIGIKTLENKSGFSADEIRAHLFGAENINAYQTGKISSQEFFDSVRKSFNVEMEFEEFGGIWNSSFALEPIVGEDIIGKLAEDYKLIILSDTNELHFDYILANFPVLRHFDEYILSYKAGHLKPSTEIFNLAVAAAACQPAECVFIDDVESNVEGAKKAGLHGIHFISPAKLKEDINRLLEKKVF